MTPLQIEILFHYNSRAADYRDGDHSAPAVKEALGWFLDEEMIRHEGFRPERFGDGQLKARYALTPRGKAFVEYLQTIPLPTASWSFNLVSTPPKLCTCSPLTNYTGSPHEPCCPLASDQCGGKNA